MSLYFVSNKSCMKYGTTHCHDVACMKHSALPASVLSIRMKEARVKKGGGGSGYTGEGV